MIRRSSALLFCAVGLASAAVCAQEYSFRSFGLADGLNNLAVRGIYQDRVGFIWASTENGIYRYDGERFEGFGPAQGMPINSGAAFGDAPDGSLLVGGDFGLYRLSGNRFEKVAAFFKTINWAQGIQADRKGHTFLGTDLGLVELSIAPGSDLRRNGFAMRTFSPAPGASEPNVYGVLVDGDAVWYGCGRALCRTEGSSTRVWGRESGLPDRNILGIRKDREGNLWVRARNEGVLELQVGQRQFKRPDAAILATALGGNPAVDEDGQILLPSPDGLFIQHGDGWQKVDRLAGLHGTVYAAFEDRQHFLWVGLAGRGIAQWRGYGEWESYSAASGLGSDIVYEIVPVADGTIWVATEGGLYRGERRRIGIEWKRFAPLGALPVHSLRMTAGGDLWAGTETRGVARIHVATGAVEWFSEAQGLAGRAAYRLRFDRDGRLLVATEAGLFVSNAPYRTFARVTELPSTRFWAIAQGTDGTVWAGGAGGLFELSGGKWRNFKPADGLSNLEVLSLGAGPNGTIWAGYRFGGGIDRIHPKPGGVTIEKGVQRPGTTGLVYFLNFDEQGRLWAGTEKGVDMWDGARWNHYDMSDGLAWDDCNLNGWAQESGGAIWIGTSGGLARFQPRVRTAPEVPLDVVFTRLAIGQTDVSALVNPSFGIRSNSFVARYSVLNASHENEVLFRYRLEGAGSSWIETAQRELQFAKLAPGAYKLEIEAQDRDGVWSAHRAEFAFRILTPWYWSWWFIGLCILIPLSTVAFALRMRMLGAKRREQRLIRMVEEKTADLQRANEELLRLSFTDPLTGLANRRVFDQALEKECARRTRTGAPLSLVILDVDQFKNLNDSEGHQRGDEILVLLGAELMRIARRRIDVAARLGGEEFALLLPETSAANAVQVAESVRLAIAAMELPNPGSPVSPFLTVSAGVATADIERWNTPDTLVAAADQALYRAKRTGRNRAIAAEWDEAGHGAADLSGAGLA